MHLLEAYKDIVKDKEKAREELEEYRSRVYGCSGVDFSSKVDNSNKTDTSDKVARLEELQINYLEAFIKSIKTFLELWNFIDSLDIDYDVKIIVKYRYLEFFSIKELMKEFGYSRGHIHRLLAKIKPYLN